jgi:predicted nucleic acid-binding protein
METPSTNFPVPGLEPRAVTLDEYFEHTPEKLELIDGYLIDEPGEPERRLRLLETSQRVVSSRIVEVEAYRALDRARLIGQLDDAETAVKRHELSELLRRLDLAPIDDPVLERARSTFSVNVRTLDAIHVATAEVLAALAAEPLEFWTHDEGQSLAALSRGLDVRGAPPPLPATE